MDYINPFGQLIDGPEIAKIAWNSEGWYAAIRVTV